jgi:hypothetical protein
MRLNFCQTASEVAQLQEAMHLLHRPPARLDELEFGFGQGEILGPLEVVEIGQTVER